MPMLIERHRHYALNDEDDVAQLEHDYRRMLHGRRPDKLALKDGHIHRHTDKAHVDAVAVAYRGIRGYSHFDCASGVPTHNPARLVLDRTPAQMLSALGEDIDHANWAGWTCLHMAAWYGSLPHVEALLDATPRAASALRPSARDFTLAAGCTSVDAAKFAIRKFVHKPSAISSASTGWKDREAILWRLNEAAMKEWIALVSPNASAAYRQAFTAAVRALWLALGGKHLGPPIRREGYKGGVALGFDGAVRLFGGGERTKKISLPDCYRIWAESAATEAQGHLLGGQLRGLLWAMLPVRPNLRRLSASVAAAVAAASCVLLAAGCVLIAARWDSRQPHLDSTAADQSVLSGRSLVGSCGCIRVVLKR